MTEPINLNRFRKAKRRAAEQRQAAENRVVFGRPKAARKADRLASEKVARALDHKRLDREDDG